MDKIHAQIVGVLNCSPDSFSDGRQYDDETMRARIQELLTDGIDRLDIGGESTAPWSEPVDEKTELARLELFFRNKTLCTVPFSVDTIKSKVAKQAILEGADMINDVSGGRFDPDMIALMAEYPKVRYVLMHSIFADGRAKTQPRKEGDILDIVSRFFEERIAACESAGMKRENIILDPWMGAFLGTDPSDSIRILKSIPLLRERFGLPFYIGASRKGFLSSYAPDHWPQDRIGSSLAASIAAMLAGAEYVRVHDVRIIRQFLGVWQAVYE